MKKTILSSFALAFTLFACAQTPPKQVNDAFSKKFNNASEVKWEQEKTNEWECEFTLDGKKLSASFDSKGNWQETEAEINKKDISAEAHKAINLNFKGWEIEKAESIETPTFSGYEIVLEKKDTKTEILVTKAGEITIKKVNVEEEKDDDEE